MKKDVPMYQPLNRFVLFVNNLSHMKKRTIRIFLDGLIILLSYYLSYSVRFEWAIPEKYFNLFLVSSPVLVGLSLFMFIFLGAYSEYWVYWSVRDLQRLFVVHSSVVLLLFLVDGVTKVLLIPRSIFVIYWFFTILLLGAVRMVSRTLLEIQGLGARTEKRKRILIVGAGRSGEMLIRQILSDPLLQYNVVGLIDDDPVKINRSIHGIRVMGDRTSIPKIVRSDNIDEIIIAVPSAKSSDMQKIVELCGRSGAVFRTVPGSRELVDGKITFNRVRKVRIEDILGREQSSLDFQRVSELIEGNAILVTGAAGSIGSELCRQIHVYKPSKLIAVDRDENSLFYLTHELKDRCPIEGVVTQVSHRKKMESLIHVHNPKVIFHAAAYKHVPCMELFPDEAILNNLGATMVLAQAALDAKVEKFVQISTDKAVYPTSIMGASKRLCELYVQYLSRNSECDFFSVRFGNVIGSKGSVFTIFEKQIRDGGPVTITDPSMERYFMSIDEACKLVLEAAAMGEKGQNFVLDMGDPIKIIDLAKHMISLAGFMPGEDIAIETVGARPGEKIKEALWYPHENPVRTANPKIYVATDNREKPQHFDDKVEEILHFAEEMNTSAMLKKIIELVPEYKSSSVED